MSVTVSWESTAICSHVITDGQWLQENLLCLASNAVKYSRSGPVVLTIRLQPATRNDSASVNSLLQDLDPPTPYPGQGVDGEMGLPVHNATPFRGVDGDRGRLDSEELIDIEGSRFSNSSFGRGDLASTGEVQHESEGKRSGVDSPTALREDPLVPLFLHFAVEDNGIGLTPEIMENLFRPFKQAQRMTGGTGLGLYSLAKRYLSLPPSLPHFTLLIPSLSPKDGVTGGELRSAAAQQRGAGLCVLVRDTLPT